MNNLVLKAKGVKEISRSQLFSFPVPEATDTYCPISNLEIIETTLEGFTKHGLAIKEEFHKCDGSGNKFVGGFVISRGDNDSGLFFGYKNSYDKSMTAAYALGARIFICSNSVVTGEQSLIRKHTGRANIIIMNAIQRGIGRLDSNFQRIQNDLNKMKEIQVSRTVAASLIGRLYLEEEVITSHQLSIIKKEYNHESFDYGVKDSLYNLYQAVTHSLKISHPKDYLRDHIDAHRFFSEYAGIAVGEPNDGQLLLELVEE